MQLSDKINKKTTLNNSVRFFVLCVQMAEKVSSKGPDPSFLAGSVLFGQIRQKRSWIRGITTLGSTTYFNSRFEKIH